MSIGPNAGVSPQGLVVSVVGPLHAHVLAAVHAESELDRPWSAAEIHTLLSMPGSYGLLAEAGGRPCGFLLARAAGGEAEILMIAVLPGRRRGGLGRRLLDAGCRRARDLGASVVFLEVATDNEPALSFYRAAGFERTAIRSGYYRRAEGAPPTDAIVMRRDLSIDVDS